MTKTRSSTPYGPTNPAHPDLHITAHGLKERMPFTEGYLCMRCKRIFYDNPDLPVRAGIECPWCGRSYYCKAPSAKARKVIAQLREVTKLLSPPQTPAQRTAIGVLTQLITKWSS